MDANISLQAGAKYKLVVNFELKHHLLMMATQAKVVKPQSLKDEIEKLLTDVQNFYIN